MLKGYHEGAARGGMITMPRFLATRNDQKLKEKYGDYCLRSILRGREAKPFEEFMRGG